MADQKISQLSNAATALTDQFVVAKSGANNNTTGAQIKTLVSLDAVFTSTNNKGPENIADYSQNIGSVDPKTLIPQRYVQPVNSTIATAIITLDSDTIVNQMAFYTGSGGNITIDSDFLNVDQEYAINQFGTDQFTLVAGSGGVTLLSPDGLLTSRVQYSTVGIYKKDATTFIITGDLA